MAPSHCHTAQSHGWVSRVKNDTHTAGPMLQILSSSSIRLQQGSEHVTAAVLTRQVTEGQSTGESGGGRGTSVYCLFAFKSQASMSPDPCNWPVFSLWGPIRSLFGFQHLEIPQGLFSPFELAMDPLSELPSMNLILTKLPQSRYYHYSCFKTGKLWLREVNKITQGGNQAVG